MVEEGGLFLEIDDVAVVLTEEWWEIGVGLR